jgi:hypothetical protein
VAGGFGRVLDGLFGVWGEWFCNRKRDMIVGD